MPNKIVEIQVSQLNLAANILTDVNANSAARAVREVAHDYERATEQRSTFRDMLKQVVESPTPALLRKARELVEGDA